MKKVIYGLLAIALLLVGSIFVSAVPTISGDVNGNTFSGMQAMVGNLIDKVLAKEDVKSYVAEVNRGYKQKYPLENFRSCSLFGCLDIVKETPVYRPALESIQVHLDTGEIDRSHDLELIAALLRKHEDKFSESLEALGLGAGPLRNIVENQRVETQTQ